MLDPEHVVRLFAKRLRQLRIVVGLSQTEIARRADVSRVTWNRWESGLQSPLAPHLPLIALSLRVSVKDLFDFTELDGSTARAA